MFEQTNWFRATTIAMIAAATLLGSAIAGEATSNSNNMKERFARGLAVLNQAVDAAGGPQALRGITSISFTARGDTYNDLQGFAADRIGNPERDGKLTIINDFDFAGSRFAQRTLQELAGGFAIDTSTLYRNATAYALRNNGKEYVQTLNAPSPSSAGGLVMIVSRFSPPLLLQRAQQNARSVTWIGEAHDADLIEFSFDEITRFRLQIAKSNHAIVRLEAVVPDAVSGDDVGAVEYTGRQIISGIAFPTRLTTIRRGVKTFDLAIEKIAVNPTFPDTLFQPPSDYRQVSDDKIATKQINAKIYEVSGLGGGNYRSQFIVMEDFVVVFEAPLGIPATKQVVAEIRKVEAVKPIKYVVISHFHSDHAGGIGVYTDLGATIVSAAENEKILRTYAQSRSLVQGLGGNRTDLTMSYLPVGRGGIDIVDAAGNKLQVIDFKTPHVERLLALYEPKTATVINGDLFSKLVRWNQTFEVFANWLKANNPKVEWVLGTHHEPMTGKDILRAAGK